MNISLEKLSRSNGARHVRHGARRALERSEREQARQTERLLDLLGLEKQPSTLSTLLPGLGLLSAGALLGAACVMLFAPRIVAERAQEHERRGD